MIVETRAIISVIVAGFILSCSPGPSMLYILSRTAAQGRKAGVVSALGLATGGFFHVLLATIGISAVIIANPVIFRIIKLAGALYLVYLGVQAARDLFRRARTAENAAAKPKDAALSSIYFQAAVTEITNPKTVVFFLSFIPQFINPHGIHVPMQSFILGSMIPLTAVPSDLIIALGGGFILKKLFDGKISGVVVQALSSLVLIGLGMRVAII
ncbi:LysE family translocator [Paraburkholderia unamae]|uniref:Threonine/homoserine/homoserine lactone efflux protein n=1 Tax=Paraburkholderia unamae TaxID=219649 RepID=A0ABX5K8M3_9BURK|nr:LysE family translocator [Paraburkholderia unamae]PVX70894.1 threonine/homoserine/homoserine lactone efflux protein [Paraburkholderia unamae]